MKVLPSVLLNHLYENTPSPVGVMLVINAAEVFSQITWSSSIVPGSKLITVTLTTFDSSMQVFIPTVDMTSLLYQVSALSAGGK